MVVAANDAFCLCLLAGARQRQCRTEPDFTIERAICDDVGEAAPFLLQACVAERSAPPEARLGIVPRHLGSQRAAEILVDGAARQKLIASRLANFENIRSRPRAPEGPRRRRARGWR